MTSISLQTDDIETIIGPTVKIRKRITRACDQCRKLRTKCDGQLPCAHCQKTKQSACTYLHRQSKRGKASEAYKKGRLARATEAGSITALELDIAKIPEFVYVVSNGDQEKYTNTGIEPKAFLAYAKYPAVNAEPGDSPITIKEESPVDNSDEKNEETASESPKPLNETKFKFLTAIIPLLDHKLTLSLVESIMDEYLGSDASEHDMLFQVIRKSSLLAYNDNNQQRVEPRKLSRSLALGILWQAVMRSKLVSHDFKAELSGLFETYLLSELTMSSSLDDVLACLVVADIYAKAGHGRLVAVKLWKTAMFAAHQLQLNVEDDSIVDPEIKEQRRRVWWYLYALDKHLAFLLDSAVVVLDKDSLNLLSPCSSLEWESTSDLSETSSTAIGPCFDIRELDEFSCKIPLSCILGLIMDVHHLSQHAFLSIDESEISCWKKNIEKQLTTAISSLETFADATSSRKNSLVFHYAKFGLKVASMYLEAPLDAAVFLDQIGTLKTESVNHLQQICIEASRPLEQILKNDPHLSLCPPLYSIYFFKYSTLVLVLNNVIDITTDSEFRNACQLLVRIHDQFIVKYGLRIEVEVRDAVKSWIDVTKAVRPERARLEAERIRKNFLDACDSDRVPLF